MALPQYPLRVVAYDGRETLCTDEDSLAYTLEFHDTDYMDTHRIWDALGRPVRAKLERLDVHVLELYETPPVYYRDPQWSEGVRKRLAQSSPSCLLAVSAVVLGGVVTYLVVMSQMPQ